MMWIVLFISSFFELGFTVCLKLSEGFRKKEMDSPLHLFDDLLNRAALNCDNRIAPKRCLCGMDRCWHRTNYVVRHCCV